MAFLEHEAILRDAGRSKDADAVQAKRESGSPEMTAKEKADAESLCRIPWRLSAKSVKSAQARLSATELRDRGLLPLHNRWMNTYKRTHYMDREQKCTPFVAVCTFRD